MLNQRGMAALEIIPMLAIFVVMLTFSLGFFGAIHTGILNSIASRNYAFETFRHRADLTYLRDNIADDSFRKNFYKASQLRVHGTVTETSKDLVFNATQRPIQFGREPSSEGLDRRVHNNEIMSLNYGQRYSGQGVDPIWVRTHYGICLNSICGKDVGLPTQ